MSANPAEPSAPIPPTGTAFPLTSPRCAVLATRTWAPSSPPRALLLLLHGAGGHSGYFSALACSLTAQSIFAASYDQPGCGYSAAEPIAPEGCVHFGSFDDIVDDVFRAISWARKEAGDSDATLPLYLFGESFGGLQVLAAAFEAESRSVDIAGVVISGALIRICPALLPPKPLVSLCNFLASYFPRAKLPAIDLSATFDAAFRDKRWARVMRGDAAIDISPRPTLASLKCTLGTGKALGLKAAEFPVPLLAVHGVRDCRCEISAVEEFVQKAGARASLHVIETEGHQLLQDTPETTANVIAKMTAWVTNSLSVK